jgi:hypothetical protein
MKIYIQNNTAYRKAIEYTLSLMALSRKKSILFVDSPENADFRIDETSDSDLPLARNFYESIALREFDYRKHFGKGCVIYTKDGKKDLLATCFYMINSLQEYGAGNKDELGRFSYAQSYQHAFGVATKNLVQQYFDELYQHPKLRDEKNSGEHSSVFISHDIDNIHGAWLEDGFAALRHGQIHHLFRLLFNAAIYKPDWFNMDRIMNIHDEYDLKSTFFWLANKGKNRDGILNSDYDIRNEKVQQTIAQVKARGFENGIHKSVSDESFQSEQKKLGFTPLANRYHFLKFSLPEGYNAIENAGLKMDASLGFAEHYGFRNSYGKAFQPYHIAENRPYNFVEVPLHVMDRTFFNYMKTPAQHVADTVIRFFEENEYNCTLSILWHNNFFDSIKYKGYLQEYKKIIAYLYENKFHSLSQQQLISKYSITPLL